MCIIGTSPYTPQQLILLIAYAYHAPISDSFPWDKHRFPLFYNTVAAVIGGLLTNKNLSKYAFFLV